MCHPLTSHKDAQRRQTRANRELTIQRQAQDAQRRQTRANRELTIQRQSQDAQRRQTRAKRELTIQRQSQDAQQRQTKELHSKKLKQICTTRIPPKHVKKQG